MTDADRSELQVLLARYREQENAMTKLSDDARVQAHILREAHDELLALSRMPVIDSAVLKTIRDRVDRRLLAVPLISPSAIADLCTWFNKHTFVLQPGPPKPSEIVYNEGTPLCPR